MQKHLRRQQIGQEALHGGEVKSGRRPSSVGLAQRHVIGLPVLLDQLWDVLLGSGWRQIAGLSEHQIREGAGCPAIAAKKRVNPVQPPHGIGGKVHVSLFSSGYVVGAHLLRQHGDEIVIWRLIEDFSAVVLYCDGTIPEAASASVNLVYGNSLKFEEEFRDDSDPSIHCAAVCKNETS